MDGGREEVGRAYGAGEGRSASGTKPSGVRWFQKAESKPGLVCPAAPDSVPKCSLAILAGRERVFTDATGPSAGTARGGGAPDGRYSVLPEGWTNIFLAQKHL